VYYADARNGGKSQPVLPLSAKRSVYRDFMKKPSGAMYRVEGKTIFITDNNGASLRSRTFYVTMAKTRTTDINEEMALPEDVLETVYTMVMKKLRERLMNPQDIIADNLPAGNKQS
jgi:site-specific DNA-cytosine methylase